MSSRQILAHGGRLIDRSVRGAEREKKLAAAASLPKITLSARQQSDLDMIACGALSPLEGFMGEKDYLSVINTMRLASGLPWTIPITLAVTEEEGEKLKVGDDTCLVGARSPRPGEETPPLPLALLHLEEKFPARREMEAEKVYKTTETAHPGVAA
ncbi:MAG: sulfate adenylyltransferase, partial [Deltaproteobacteria bacterium]|nr:sulfate adenylyltransferase [Deltaproteobacteria bacterium]